MISILRILLKLKNFFNSLTRADLLQTFITGKAFRISFEGDNVGSK